MFITFEGPEGSGKSTQLPQLAQFLEEAGFTVVKTREPGGTKIGDQIREILMRMENTELHPRTEILLFLAARAQLVEELIKPSLQSGTIILCDRYGDSTMAYQGYGHGLDLKILRSMLKFATGGLKPDLTFLLDVDVMTGLKRKKIKEEWNRLDAFELSFHERVRKGYHRLAQEEPERWRIIDATQDPEQVQEEIRIIVLEALKQNMKKQQDTSLVD
ncbi:MAG: dTMP kinase [Anaerolineaceae bacterium]|nr:dTMP kinase [Anaerolineaceae bacterium]MDD4042556.1 dTMP kinase [Anaerolineaceae bacterium]MDD4578339.1 dTMP kinase [Anaerolineaceae bacterium]